MVSLRIARSVHGDASRSVSYVLIVDECDFMTLSEHRVSWSQGITSSLFCVSRFRSWSLDFMAASFLHEYIVAPMMIQMSTLGRIVTIVTSTKLGVAWSQGLVVLSPLNILS